MKAHGLLALTESLPMATVSAATPSPDPSPTHHSDEGEAEASLPSVDAAAELEAKAKAAKERYSGVVGWFGRIVSKSPKTFFGKSFNIRLRFKFHILKIFPNVIYY